MRGYITVKQLIKRYYEENPDGHYFDKETLKFFGERISEMRVLVQATSIWDINGNYHQYCYILSSLQRNHPIKPTRHYTYFDIYTMEQVIPRKTSIFADLLKK